jgi:hypothetical protein
MERAMDYVVNGQGGEMPEFDSPPIRYPHPSNNTELLGTPTANGTDSHSPIRYRERY